MCRIHVVQACYVQWVAMVPIVVALGVLRGAMMSQSMSILAVDNLPMNLMLANILDLFVLVGAMKLQELA